MSRDRVLPDTPQAHLANHLRRLPHEQRCSSPILRSALTAQAKLLPWFL